MAKRKRNISSQVIRRRITEGRGSGYGRDYKPWYRIQDVASRGLVSRVKGWKTERVHHFLSLLELRYFYVLEWEQSIIDIREQYPLLPVEETMAIAEECGIVHPADPKNKHPVVMTTDFLYTIRLDTAEIDHAHTIKYENDLQSNRTLEKLEIERRYWGTRQVDWRIVTQRDIPAVLARNVEWVHQYVALLGFSSLPDPVVEQVISRLTRSVSIYDLPLSELALHTDKALGLEVGTSLSMVRHLIATRRWRINMNLPINPSKRLRLI